MLHQLIQRLSSRIPSQCAVCHAWPSQPVCEACVVRFAQPEPRCLTCALPLPAGVKQCGECLKHPPPLDACVAAVAYVYPWSELIVGYKFNGHPGRAALFALLLRSTPWVEPALDQAHLLVPMPLSKQRLQERGFNQTLLLARHLAPDKTDAHLLLRIKDAPPQSRLNRRERLHNVKDAFAIEPLCAHRLKGQRVVLVDDVMTSGASLYAAASTLKAAGASHVSAIVVARTEF